MFVQEKEKKIGYSSIIKEKNYLFYLLGQLISRFGDSIDTIAYGWMVYEVTGKTSLMALLFGINAIPTILFQPIAGVFNALTMAATPIGSLLVAGLCVFLSTSSLFLIFGIGTVILFILQRFNKGLSDI